MNYYVLRELMHERKYITKEDYDVIISLQEDMIRETDKSYDYVLKDHHHYISNNLDFCKQVW